MRIILDRLLLSSLSEANDPFFLDSHHVQAILYYGEGGLFSDEIKLYQRSALPDGSLDDEMLRDGIDFLRESLRAGRRVLAVGPSGATIVAAYLAEMGFSSAQARQMLGETEPGATYSPLPDDHLLDQHAEELHRRSTRSVGH